MENLEPFKLDLLMEKLENFWTSDLGTSNHLSGHIKSSLWVHQIIPPTPRQLCGDFAVYRKITVSLENVLFIQGFEELAMLLALAYPRFVDKQKR